MVENEVEKEIKIEDKIGDKVENEVGNEVQKGKLSYYCVECDIRIIRNSKQELDQVDRTCIHCFKLMEIQENECEDEEEDVIVNLDLNPEEEAEIPDHEKRLRVFSIRYQEGRENKGKGKKGKGKGKGKIIEPDPPCPVFYEEDDEEECGDMEIEEMVEFALDLLNNGTQDYFFIRGDGEDLFVFEISFKWMAAVLRAARTLFDEKLRQGIGGFGLTCSQISHKRNLLETALCSIAESRKLNDDGQSCLWLDDELAKYTREFTDESNFRQLIDHLIQRAEFNDRLKYPTYLPKFEPPGKNIYNQSINANGEVIRKGKGKDKGKGDAGNGKGKGNDGADFGKGGNPDFRAPIPPPARRQDRDEWPALKEDPLNYNPRNVEGWNKKNQVETESIVEVLKQTLAPMVEIVGKFAEQREDPIRLIQPGFPKQNIIKNQGDQENPLGAKVQALEAGLLRVSGEVVEIKNQSKNAEQKLETSIQALSLGMEQMATKIVERLELAKESPEFLKPKYPKIKNKVELVDLEDPEAPKPLHINLIPPKVNTPGSSSSADLTRDQLLSLPDWPAETIYLRQLMDLLKTFGFIDENQNIHGLGTQSLLELKDQLADFYKQSFQTFPDFMLYVKDVVIEKAPELQGEPAVIPILDDEPTTPKKVLQCVICLKFNSANFEVTSPGTKCWASCKECRYERNIWPVHRFIGEECSICGEADYLYAHSTRQNGICYGCDPDESRSKVKSVVKCPTDKLYYMKLKIGTKPGDKSMGVLKGEQVRLKKVNKKGEQLSLEACPDNDTIK